MYETRHGLTTTDLISIETHYTTADVDGYLLARVPFGNGSANIAAI